jgi:hypothetical protein
MLARIPIPFYLYSIIWRPLLKPDSIDSTVHFTSFHPLIAIEYVKVTQYLVHQVVLNI